MKTIKTPIRIATFLFTTLNYHNKTANAIVFIKSDRIKMCKQNF